MNKLFLLFLITTSLSITSCNRDDSQVESTITYGINPFEESGVSGTAKFIREGNDTIIEIRLMGTTPGLSHPTHIHFNSIQEGGDIAITLEPVNGDTGTSTTRVTQLDDGTTIDYGNVIFFDGHIDIHLSQDDLQKILAKSNIGPNT